MLSNITEN